ncbi:hypothetical protein, conserved, partial [Babesia bigemina]
MGFLSGVLEDVSEKQPYSVGKTMLKEFVESELKPKLSTGREGFEFIAQVAGTVREYNERVKESNNHVKTIINNMDRDMKTLQNEVGKILQHNPDSENFDEVKQGETLVTKLADEYAKKGMNFDSNFVIREMNAWMTGAKVEPKQQFKDLNADLRLKITHARNNITHEAERLTTLSKKQKENLAAMTSMISNKLKTLKSCVNDRIMKDVNELVSKVNEKVAAILKLLKSISETLWDHVNELGRWIKEADEISVDAVKDVKGIIDNGVGWHKSDPIKEQAKQLKDKATELYWKFEGATRSVEDGVKNAKTEKVSELDKWKAAGDAAVNKAKEKCDQIVGKLKGQGSETGIVGERKAVTNAAEQLKIKADELRGKAYAAKTQIETLVSQALGEVKTMDDALRTNLRTVRDGIKSGIMDYIKNGLNGKIKVALTEMTDKIAHRDEEKPAKPGHLDKIVKGIKTYAERFSKEDEKTGFKGVVKGWLADILQSTPVTTTLATYIGGSKVGTLDNAEGIAQAIVAELKVEVTTAVDTFKNHVQDAGDSSTKIEDYILAVNNVCEKFAKAVGLKIKGQVEIGGVSRQMAENIKHVFTKVQSPVGRESDLAQAIRLILLQLIGAASQAGNAVHSFASIADDGLDDDDYDLGKNLTDGVGGVKKLGTQLYQQLQQAGGDRSSHFADFNGQIASTVNPIIGTEDVTDRSHKVTLDETKFSGYLHSVSKTVAGKKELIGDTGEGSLPQSIKKIQNEINEKQEYLKNVSNGESGGNGTFDAKTFETLNGQITSNLTAFTGAVEQLVKKDRVNTTVNAYLEDVSLLLNSGDPVDLKSDIKDTHPSVKGLVTIKEEIDSALDGIKNKADAEFDAAKATTDSGNIFTTLSTAITTNLKDLLAAFEEAGKQVNKHLQKLKTNIGKKEHGADAAVGTLQKIHDNLVTLLNGDISQVINDATAFKKQANQLRDKTIGALNGHVEDEVKKAETALITQANKNYVTSVKEMLTAFADKVQKELKPLPGEIDTDRQHGFKGFMRTLQGTFNGDETLTDNIDKLKGLVSELS